MLDLPFSLPILGGAGGRVCWNSFLYDKIRVWMDFSITYEVVNEKIYRLSNSYSTLVVSFYITNSSYTFF
jgi:hypothetical protein